MPTTSLPVLTAADVEADCRAFAAQYPTPNTLRAIALAEAGRVSWFDLYPIFRDALATGLRAVTA